MPIKNSQMLVNFPMLRSNISLGVNIEPQGKSVVAGFLSHSREYYPKIPVYFSEILRFRTLKLILASIHLVLAPCHQRCS